MKDKFSLFKKAFEKLLLSLDSEEIDEFRRDSVVKRFEFTFELCWKTLKLYLEESGLGIFNTPRDVFKESFRAGILNDGDVFLAMINDRNLTVHMYDEGIAAEIFKHVEDSYVKSFADLVQILESKM